MSTRPSFIPSDADPRRDQGWYRRNVEEAADAESARREHARTPEDAFRSPEGVFFKRFSREQHVKELAVVANWQTYRAIDFGYRHPACLWAQRSPAGQLFIVDELLPENRTTPEFVAAIKAREAELSASRCRCLRATATRPARAPTCRLPRASSRSCAVRVLPRSVRAPGCATAACASWTRSPTRCMPLVIASRCEGLIRALSQVKPKRAQGEVYDTDHEIFSHPLDALRYLLVNLGSGGGDPYYVNPAGGGPLRGPDGPLPAPSPYGGGVPGQRRRGHRSPY